VGQCSSWWGWSWPWCWCDVADFNSYVSGQCTWWCKNQASWVRNGWGNAAEWLTNAKNQGFQTSQKPQTGAIAIWGPGVDPPWGFGHCAKVLSTRSDGSFTVTEMNWKGTGVVDTRNVAPSDPNLMGFILAPGTQAGDGSGDATGVGSAIQGAGAQLVSAGQIAGGGLLVLGGLVLAVLLVVRPGPLRALR
jgi:hypothetical protein